MRGLKTAYRAALWLVTYRKDRSRADPAMGERHVAIGPEPSNGEMDAFDPQDVPSPAQLRKVNSLARTRHPARSFHQYDPQPTYT